MQKVITVTTHTNIIEGDNKFVEKEYPKINAYLEDGFEVKQVVPVVTNADNSYMYTITFVLEK